MDSRSSYRVFGWLAIVSFLLVAVPLVIAPIPPLGLGADLVAFDVAHRGALLAGNYLGVIELPVGLVVLIFIAAVVRQAEERARGWLWVLILGSGVCTTAVGAVAGLAFVTQPLVAGLGQAALALLTQLGLFGLIISYALQALLMGAIGVASLRLRCLPGWLGYLAWVAAILSGLATLALLVTTGPLSANSPVPLFAGGLSAPAWQLLLGIYWITRPAAPPMAVAATS